MKRKILFGGVFSAVIMVILAVSLLFAPFGETATDNPSPASTGYEVWHFYIPGPVTSTATPIKFNAPWPFRVLGVSAYGGTVKTNAGSETYTLDVQQGTTSLLTAPMSLATQATILNGTLATSPNITDEATVSLILTLGGSNPSITDLTISIPVKRR